MQLEVPVYLGQEETVTRNVSWSGIYFLTDRPLTAGGDLTFSLNLSHALSGKPLTLSCHGEVLRVERYGGRFGVAVRINDFQYLQ